MRAGPQPDRELLDRLGGDDDIMAGANEQERLADARRHDRVGEIVHRLERRADPRDGRRAEAELRLGFDDGTGAGIAHRIGRQRISRERLRRDRGGAAARDVGRAHAHQAHDARGRARQPRHAHQVEIEHRRRQDDAVEPAPVAIGRAHQHVRPHRMGKRKERRRAIGQHDLLHEGFEIDLVLGEIEDVALAAVAQRPLRQTLAAPVQRGHGKAALARVLHDFEIFFDELGAAMEQAQGALATRRRVEAREAKLDPVGGLDGSGDRAVGDRIRRDRHKRHGESHRKGGASGIGALYQGSQTAQWNVNADLWRALERGPGASHITNSAGPCGLRCSADPAPWRADPQLHVAQGGYAMRSFDLAPLYRSTVGFDRLFSLLDQVGGLDGSAPTYPPYNIERLDETAYRVTVAVAGFTESELALEVKENTLTIRGEKQVKDGEKAGEVLYQGIAARAFERRFQLADHVQVTGANLENGLLHVDLKREIPEAKKPRQIPIGSGASKVIDAKKAA